MPPDPDDDLAALRAALDVDPRPGFAAGVRHRIDREPARAWRPLAVGASALAVAALAAAVLIGQPWSRRAAPPSMPPDAVREQARVAPAPAPTVVLPAAIEPPMSARAPAPRLAGTIRAADPIRPEPRVLIARDDARAFARLLMAVRTGQVALPAEDDPLTQVLARVGEASQPASIVRVLVPLEIEPYPELENR